MKLTKAVLLVLPMMVMLSCEKRHDCKEDKDDTQESQNVRKFLIHFLFSSFYVIASLREAIPNLHRLLHKLGSQ